MEFRNRQQLPLTIWLGINLLAAILGLFATLRLVLRVWDFLDGLYGFPTLGISAFPFELRLFFIVGFCVAGLLIGIVTGLTQWWMLRRSHVTSSLWILFSTICWLIGLPLSYEIFAILHDILSRSFSATSLMLVWLLFLIYLTGGIIASIGEYFIPKFIDI